MSGDPDPSGAEAQGAVEGADASEAKPAKAIEKFAKEKEFLKVEGKEKLDKEELKVEGKEKHDKEGKEKHDKEAGKEKHDKEGKDKHDKEKQDKEKQDKDGKNEKLEKEKHDKEAGKEKHDKEAGKEKHDKERGKDFAKEKDKLELLEKLPDFPSKDVAEAGGVPPFDPATAGLDAETLLAHAASLEEAGRQLRHFIEQSQRPDLKEGALRDEPDQQDEEA